MSGIGRRLASPCGERPPWPISTTDDMRPVAAGGDRLLSGRLTGIIAKPQPISSVWKAQALRRQRFSGGTAGTERVNLAACVTRWRDWECLVELNSQADFDQSLAIDVNVAVPESTRTLECMLWGVILRPWSQRQGVRRAARPLASEKGKYVEVHRKRGGTSR